MEQEMFIPVSFKSLLSSLEKTGVEFSEEILTYKTARLQKE